MYKASALNGDYSAYGWIPDGQKILVLLMRLSENLILAAGENLLPLLSWILIYGKCEDDDDL